MFPWSKTTLSKEAQARDDRLRARNVRKSLFEPSTSAQVTEKMIPDEQELASSLVPDFACEECIEEQAINDGEVPDDSVQQKSASTQTSVTLKMFSTELLLTDNEAIMFYTGIESYQKFHMLLNTLLPMGNNLKYRWSKVISVSVEDQFLILLIKLRRNKPDYELSKMFNISKTEVSNIIVTWIHFVNDVWSLIDIWPRRDLVDFYMPIIFRRESSKTRVIIDATEVPIAKPSNPTAQRATYSSYKNTNTIKFLVGSTPGGLICYCSQGYGGATSDRQMIERSSILMKETA